ncbi:MAG: hypothetical protein KAS80_03445 [Anaerolineales bacterium]|nr:hypothetical protein [Anaerolineales bacterium]
MTSKNRPRPVTWLAVGVLTFSVMQFAGLTAWFTLPDLPTSVPKGYLFMKNGFWGSVGLIAAMALFFGRNWAPKLTYIGAIAYAAWLWIDRLLLQRSDYASSSFPFTFGAMTLCFLIVIWILSRPSVHQYYEEQNE